MTNTPKPSSSSSRASLTAKLAAATTDQERLVILGIIRRLSQLTGEENSRAFLADLLRNAVRNRLSPAVLPRFLEAFEQMGGDRRQLVKSMRQDPALAALLARPERKQFHAPLRALPLSAGSPFHFRPRSASRPRAAARTPKSEERGRPRQRKSGSASRLVAIARRISGERTPVTPEAVLSDSSNSPPHPPPFGETPKKASSGTRRSSLGKRLSDFAQRMSPIKKRRSLDLQHVHSFRTHPRLNLYAPHDAEELCVPVLRKYTRFEEGER